MFKKFLLVSALLAGSGLLSVNAAPVLSFNPSVSSVNVGDTFSVSAVLSGLEQNGLDEILAGFDISVEFNSSMLHFESVGVSFSPFHDFSLVNPLSVPTPDFFASSSANAVDFSLVSYDADDVLQSLQGGSVTLGVLSFRALQAGSSALTYSYVDLTGLASNLLDPTVENGRVNVNGNGSAVPEPATLLLMGLGALGMVGAKRRKA